MKKLTGIIVFVLTAALLFTGCANTDTTTSTETSAATSASNAASAAQSQSMEEVILKIAGSTSVGPVIETLAEKYTEAHPNVTINVEQTGSGAGVTSCGDGMVDMGMASRDVKPDEFTMYPDMQATVLCLDGVAVVVSQDNPVTGLTAEQVKQIYFGEITDWADVGGTAGPITLYSRDSVSGTREAFQGLFDVEIEDTMCIIVGSNGEMAQQVSQDPSAIGYMSLGLVAGFPVTGLSIDGVEATSENLASGEYAYSRNFNLLTLGEPTGELKNFIDYCLGDPEAIAYMTEKGYLAVN